MQADDDEHGDDERRDLERALYARPDGNAETETRRREAARRLRIESEDAADPEVGRAGPASQPGRAGPAPHAGSAGPESNHAPPEAPRRRRAALIAGGALAVGLALGAAAASAALDQPTATAPTASPTPTPTGTFEDLVEGWAPTEDLPAGMALIADGATVYTPGFETAQNDRLLLTAPNGSMLCLALQREDDTFSAGCTGVRDFFGGSSLQVIGTALGDTPPIYTRVVLNPDGTIEGGFQLIRDETPGG